MYGPRKTPLENYCNKYIEQRLRTKQIIAKNAKVRSPIRDEIKRGQKSQNYVLPTCVNITKEKKVPPVTTVFKARAKSCSDSHRGQDNWDQRLKNKRQLPLNRNEVQEIHHLYVDLKMKLKNDKDASEMLNAIKVFLQKNDINNFNIEIPPTRENKTCQTPPLLTQEDTEKLQSIISESTTKLETSMKQLEALCFKLQNENEESLKALESEKELNRDLNYKVIDLQQEKEIVDAKHAKEIERLETRIKELEHSNTNIAAANKNKFEIEIHELKKQIKKLDQERNAAIENSSKLEYDLTVLNMEKEKNAAILNLRNNEIEDIHKQMSIIQDEVHKQLMNLNKEIVTIIPSSKSTIDISNHDYFREDHRRLIGDSISSISTNYSIQNNDLLKNCGDAKPQDVVIPVK